MFVTDNTEISHTKCAAMIYILTCLATVTY